MQCSLKKVIPLFSSKPLSKLRSSQAPHFWKFGRRFNSPPPIPPAERGLCTLWTSVLTINWILIIPLYILYIQNGLAKAKLTKMCDSFRKKPNRGNWGHTFLKKPCLEFLGFLLYPWKFQIKQNIHPETPQNCVTPLWKF